MSSTSSTSPPCIVCGEVDRHIGSVCPYSLRCSRCGLFGHLETTCPSPSNGRSAVTENDEEDTIYFSGLPTNTTEEEILAFFGSIGTVKMHKDKRNRFVQVPKIHLYIDKSNGKFKGEGVLTYEDPPSAKAAIGWFNEKPFPGGPKDALISVSLAEKRKMDYGGTAGGPRKNVTMPGKNMMTGNYRRGDERTESGTGGEQYEGSVHTAGNNANFGRGNERLESTSGRMTYTGNRGGGGSGGGGSREGDWLCTECGVSNFARRQQCFKCNAYKGGNATGSSSYPLQPMHAHPQQQYGAPHQHHSHYQHRSENRFERSGRERHYDERSHGTGSSYRDDDRHQWRSERR